MNLYRRSSFYERDLKMFAWSHQGSEQLSLSKELRFFNISFLSHIPVVSRSNLSLENRALEIGGEICLGLLLNEWSYPAWLCPLDTKTIPREWNRGEKRWSPYFSQVKKFKKGNNFPVASTAIWYEEGFIYTVQFISLFVFQLFSHSLFLSWPRWM